jgi:hypothetical protein
MSLLKYSKCVYRFGSLLSRDLKTNTSWHGFGSSTKLAAIGKTKGDSCFLQPLTIDLHMKAIRGPTLIFISVQSWIPVADDIHLPPHALHLGTEIKYRRSPNGSNGRRKHLVALAGKLLPQTSSLSTDALYIRFLCLLVWISHNREAFPIS